LIQNSSKLTELRRQIVGSVKTSQRIENLESRMTVLQAPNFEDGSNYKDYRLVVRYHSYYELVGLIYFLHYGTLPPILRAEILLFLEKEVARRNRPFSQRVAITSFLNNPNMLLAYLDEQNARWIFGHFFVGIVRTLLGLFWVEVRQRKAKKPQRRRGPQDHGTLLPENQRLEKFDISFTEAQQRIEEDDHIAMVLSWSEERHYQRQLEQRDRRGVFPEARDKNSKEDSKGDNPNLTEESAESNTITSKAADSPFRQSNLF